MYASDGELNGGSSGRNSVPFNLDIPNRTRVFRIELDVESYQVRDILKAILHTILFHRILTPTTIAVGRLEDLNISYCRHSSPEILGLIDASTKTFKTYYDTLDFDLPPTPIKVLFYGLQRIEKRSGLTSWLNIGSISPHGSQLLQEMIWEDWQITLKPLPITNTNNNTKLSTKKLRDCLLQISKSAADINIDNFNLSNTNTKWRIEQPREGRESWSKLFKKMIKETAVPSLLE